MTTPNPETPQTPDDDKVVNKTATIIGLQVVPCGCGKGFVCDACGGRIPPHWQDGGFCTVRCPHCGKAFDSGGHDSNFLTNLASLEKATKW